jgi:hypothetical protein
MGLYLDLTLDAMLYNVGLHIARSNNNIRILELIIMKIVYDFNPISLYTNFGTFKYIFCNFKCTFSGDFLNSQFLNLIHTLLHLFFVVILFSFRFITNPCFLIINIIALGT